TTEVLEEHAEGNVKGIYEEIKKTFRVPLVNLVFRVLAGYPDYLQVAWRQLQPNVQTVFFERRADEVRRYAVEAMSSLGTAPQPVEREQIAPVLHVFHYVNPKLLLAVGA